MPIPSIELISLPHTSLPSTLSLSLFLSLCSSLRHLSLLFAYNMIRISKRPLSIDRTKCGAGRDRPLVSQQPRGCALHEYRATDTRVDRNDRLSVVIALGRKTSPSGLRSGPELASHGADTIQEVKSVLPSSRGIVTRGLSRTFPPFKCVLRGIGNFHHRRPALNQTTDDRL